MLAEHGSECRSSLISTSASASLRSASRNTSVHCDCWESTLQISKIPVLPHVTLHNLSHLTVIGLTSGCGSLALQFCMQPLRISLPAHSSASLILFQPCQPFDLLEQARWRKHLHLRVFAVCSFVWRCCVAWLPGRRLPYQQQQATCPASSVAPSAP